MKKSIWIYGLIIGTILCINMIVNINMIYSDPDYKANDILGYTVMVVSFSLIYFGIRNYRNKYLDSFMSFGKALKTGALIALVGATIYVIVSFFFYYLFVPDFMDVYTDYILKNTVESEVQAKTVELENLKELFKNPFFAILITYSEVLPIGLVVALVSALLLKKKQKAVTS